MDFLPSNFGHTVPPQQDQFDDFFCELKDVMALSEEAAVALMNLKPIVGFCGLLCRLRFSFQDERFRVKPEILTPLLVRELPREKLESLFVFQTSLIEERRWTLGIADEGLLQLTTVDWITDPAQVVAALDLGQTFGKLAMSQLQELH